MKPPHMPPMAKMETAMAYMNVDDSYVMFTPSERWRCAFLMNFSITWEKRLLRLVLINMFKMINTCSGALMTPVL